MEETTAEAVGRLGATPREGGVEFRIWAPTAASVRLQLEETETPQTIELEREADGCWRTWTAAARPGTRYRYRVDGGQPLPDPCSRFQPEGVHGPSEVVDPAYDWTDDGWPGLTRDELVIYELHVGTFTPEGTFQAVIDRLPYLRNLGVTAIEIMPVADFPGGRNWGYDGVALYAPSRAYGRPADLQRLVDAAHAHGLGVVLDVVYNHLGPDGNYLRAFSPFYFTERYQTPWGEAINYDGEHSAMVREFVLQNAEQWLRDYHIDGLRLDATHAIEDHSPRHLLAELTERARSATPRNVVLIAENDANDVRLVASHEQGGYGLDAVWADDFHHAVWVTLTGEQEGYYEDYQGGTSEIAAAVQGGFLYQGQHSVHRRGSRGTRTTTEPASAFVFCLQNHDQVGNRAFGERLSALVSPALYRAASALLLFAPETPLLFMGQEFAASSPFLFFTDFNEELGRLVTEGRRAEFGGFSAFRDEAIRSRIPDPQSPETFARSHLDWDEAERNAGMLALYRDLLRLRRNDPVLRQDNRLITRVIPIGERACFVVRLSKDATRYQDDARVLLVSLGDGPLVITDDMPAGVNFTSLYPLLSTEDLRYRGEGTEESDAPPNGIQRGPFAWLLSTSPNPEAPHSIDDQIALREQNLRNDSEPGSR